MIKNAIAYITRKRNRTLIIFIILTIVFSCLYSCLTIMKSSNEIEKALYESSNSSISITKKDGEYFNVNQFKDIEKLKEVEEIIIQYDGLAKLKDAKVVSGEQIINREDLSDEFKNVVSFEATNNTSSNDEVGELKQQINDLYSTLLITIDNLEFKNKEILKLEKLKYDFFKGASHELKTPLASLKIILENMKYNIGKYKDRDTYINECIEIVDSLTKNISQILSVHSMGDFPKEHNLIIFLIGFKPHYFCNCGIFRIPFKILTGILKGINE